MAKGEERIFSEEIKINKYQLEVECEKQASRYFYWAEKRANAKSYLAEKEDALKLISAQKDLEIRQNWDSKYLSTNGKQTESGIKAVLEIELQGAREDIRDAQSELFILDAAVASMDHRKSELDNLTTLLVKGFYAAPNGGKREGGTEVIEREVRNKLNKKKD